MMESHTASPVVVARIVKSHGIRGEVVLESYTDVEGRIENTPVFLAMENGVSVAELRIETRRFFNGRHVVKFAGVDNRNQADALRDKELAIPESEIGELPDDHFFIHDLVGMTVRRKDGVQVGKVQDVVKTGGVDLLQLDERGDLLIPFVDAICIEVDQEARTITIDPPEGLLQLNAR